MKIALYARVSKDEQARKSSALDQQIFLLKTTIAHWGIPEHDVTLLVDVQSGRQDDRPQFEKLLEGIRSRQFQRVVISRIDRITRNLSMNAALVTLFESTGVELFEVLRGSAIDFKNPGDWDYFVSSGVSAEGESRKLSVRVRYGMEYRRHQGKSNPRPPYGYRVVDDRYQFDPDTIDGAMGSIAIFEQEKHLRRACMRIDRELGKSWTPAGLGRWMANPILRGHTGYQKTKEGLGGYSNIHYNTHTDRLLSESRYEAIVAILSENQRLWGRNQQAAVYPLGGLLVCARCGYKMNICKSKRGDKLYLNVYCRTRLTGVKSVGCGAIDYGGIHKPPERKGLPLHTIEQVVIEALCDRAEQLADKTLAAREEQISPEVLKLQGQIQKLTAIASEIGDSDGGFSRKIAALRAEIAKHQGRPTDAVEERRSMLTSSGRDRPFWEGLTNEQRKALFSWLVDAVLIQDGQVVEVRLKV